MSSVRWNHNIARLKLIERQFEMEAGPPTGGTDWPDDLAICDLHWRAYRAKFLSRLMSSCPSNWPHHPRMCGQAAAFILATASVLATGASFAESLRVLTVPGFSCSSGPYAIRLPPRFEELRRMATRETQRKPGKKLGWENHRILHFPDLEVGVFITPRKDEYVLESARITGPQWHIAGPLRVGASAATVLNSQGPNVPSNGALKLWGPGPDVALVTIKAGLITQILYSCYAG